VTPSEPPAWHQALAHAVTGERYPELGRQERPDLGRLADFLRARLADAVPAGTTHQVPSDLREGLGAAQLWAALAELRVLLGLDRVAVRTAVTRSGPPTADDQRLLREVPPHHGG